jgi:lysophospholipase L1-like esterase
MHALKKVRKLGMNQKKSILKYFVFASLTVVLFFMLLEAVFLVFSLSKNLKSNSSEKTPNQFTIFAFGGSTVYGEPHRELSFLEELRYLLEKTYPDLTVKIVNFGHGGLCLAQVKERIFENSFQDPDLVILMSGHNEFLAPILKANPLTSCVSFLREHSAFMRFFYAFLAQRFDFLPTVAQMEFLQRDSFSPIEKRYNFIMEKIFTHLRHKDIPVFVCTLASNMLWPPPFVSNSVVKDQSFEIYYKIMEDMYAPHELTEIENNLLDLVEENDVDSMLLFLIGLVKYKTMRESEAYSYFLKARDFDSLPTRATTFINDSIRQQALSHDGASLIDIENIFKDQSRFGIIGFELISDNCHPTPKGNFLIARALYDSLRSRNLLRATPHRNVELSDLDQFLALKNWSDPVSFVRIDYLKRLVEYCSKEPFCNFYAARRYLKNLLKYFPDEQIIRNRIAFIEAHYHRPIEEIARDFFDNRFMPEA